MIMKSIALVLLLFIGVTSVQSQSGYKNGNIGFIDRFSIGAGLGAQAPIGKYPTLKETALLGNLFLQFEFSEGIFATMNTSLENGYTDPKVSYISSGIKYSLMNYKNTLYPYFETELGLYFVDYSYTFTFENIGNTNSQTNNQLFGYNVGTGLDFRLSSLVTLDINVKFHSFNINDKKNFFTFLSIFKFNL